MKPDWGTANAPEWAMWLAQDANGYWFWYSERPYLGKDGWYLRKYSKFSLATSQLYKAKQWKKSLEQRPDNKDEI